VGEINSKFSTVCNTVAITVHTDCCTTKPRTAAASSQTKFKLSTVLATTLSIISNQFEEAYLKLSYTKLGPDGEVGQINDKCR